MVSTDQSQPVPQNSEGIEEARWVSKDEMLFLLKDSFQSIRDLLAPLISD